MISQAMMTMLGTSHVLQVPMTKQQQKTEEFSLHSSEAASKDSFRACQKASGSCAVPSRPTEILPLTQKKDEKSRDLAPPGFKVVTSSFGTFLVGEMKVLTSY